MVSVVPMDALNPLKTLSFLRYKLLYIHLTNVYDNLPHDEMVRRDGRLYLVEARAWVPREGSSKAGRRTASIRAETARPGTSARSRPRESTRCGSPAGSGRSAGGAA